MTTVTTTVFETFQTMGVTVMNSNVRIETTDAVIQFCETYGFEHVFPEDAEAMDEVPLQNGEPFMYLWRDTKNETSEMRAGLWMGQAVLPKNGTSLVFKLAKSSQLWNTWAVENNVTINGDIYVDGDMIIGDQVTGDQVTGDQINVTIAPGTSGVAVGRNAVAFGGNVSTKTVETTVVEINAAGGNVNYGSTLNNVTQTIWN